VQNKEQLHTLDLRAAEGGTWELMRIIEKCNSLNRNNDRLLTGRTVMGCPFESICSLRAILRCLREQ
jgi:hypothetical protein